MSRTVLLSLFLLHLYLPFQWAEQELKVNAGYWMSGIAISDIDSTLFTHLIFSRAYVNSSSFEISIHSSDQKDFESFSIKVKQKNPSIKTLVSIWGKNSETYASMVKNLSSIKSFIQSSQNVARAHEFDGVDLYWDYPTIDVNMEGMATLLREWRLYLYDNDPELILTATVPYSPYWPYNQSVYPAESMTRYLDWVHLKTFSYIVDIRTDVTVAHSALYDPSSIYSTDYGINQWNLHGLDSSKMVLGLAFFGYAWNLTDPKNNAIGAPATDPNPMAYKDIRDQIPLCASNIVYNNTYKICTWSCGSTWIGFDDVETIKIKVSYAKEKKLRGYIAWQVSFDDNWLLSRAGHIY